MDGWHLEKSVSVGHLVTTASIVFSVVWWASTVETRIAVNTQKIQAQEAAIKKIEDSNNSLRQEMRQDFDRVHQKLDQMLMDKGRK